MDGWVARAFDLGRDLREDEGCAFILEEGGVCGAPQRDGSPYCAPHHVLCHLPKEGRGARRRQRETEALARAVGGRNGRRDRLPPDHFLRRLEKIAGNFARSECSRFVQGDGE